MPQVDVQTQIKVFDNIFDQVWLGDHIAHSTSLPTTMKRERITRINSAPPVSRAHMLKDETFRSSRRGTSRHDRRLVHQMVNDIFNNVIKSQKEVEQEERRKARLACKITSQSARFDLGEKIAMSFRRTFSSNDANSAELVTVVALVEVEEEKDAQTNSNNVAASTTPSSTESATVSAIGEEKDAQTNSNNVNASTTTSGTESATVSAIDAGNLQEVQNEQEIIGENTEVKLDLQKADNQGATSITDEADDDKENIDSVNVAIGALPSPEIKNDTNDAKKQPKAKDPEERAKVFCVGCFGRPK